MRSRAGNLGRRIRSHSSTRPYDITRPLLLPTNSLLLKRLLPRAAPPRPSYYLPMTLPNPFLPVTDYQTMRDRIGTCTFFSSLMAVWILRTTVPPIDVLLAQLSFPVDIPYIGKGTFLGYLIPASAAAWVAYSIKLHDQISNVTCIRYWFDTRHIIRPIVTRLGFSNDVSQRLFRNRHRAMSALFYKYASSKSPSIDRHSIEQALDTWSWFWVVLESVLIVGLASLLSMAYSPNVRAQTASAASLLSALVFLPFFWNQAKKYASAQIDLIIRDKSRTIEMRSAVSAL